MTLAVGFPGEPVCQVDAVTGQAAEVQVFSTTSKRGIHCAPVLRVESVYPLGICRAWSFVNLSLEVLVYPAPKPFQLESYSGGVGGRGDSSVRMEGSEDFYGLREYLPGDSLRQVAWKSVARGQSMRTKQFVDYVDDQLWLDWDMFYGFSTEERLSRICFCALQLSAVNKPFGLRLPGYSLDPDCGVGHRKKVLIELARFKAPGSGFNES